MTNDQQFLGQVNEWIDRVAAEILALQAEKDAAIAAKNNSRKQAIASSTAILGTPTISQLQAAGMLGNQVGTVIYDNKFQWTAWLNRDRPSGTGDGESIAGHLEDGNGCEKPKAVECRTSDTDKTIWKQTGQIYHCTSENGGVCRNAEQKNGKCKDYEVRFLCPVQ